ncbi:MAG TPA: OmpA family protein [Vicinamibacteria bacterium]|nr:OmpA family protein [Vicinamibacteria bacterium]
MTKMITGILAVAVSGLAAAGCGNKKNAAIGGPPAAVPERTAAARPTPAPEKPTANAFDEESWFRTATLDELQKKLSDVYFDYDRSDLRGEARQTIQNNSEWLMKPYNTVLIEVEGHCDERGTLDYNLALGERRSSSVADYLMGLGLPRHRLRIVSYGKERPQCTMGGEDCWRRNRRAHFRIASKGVGD